MKFSTIKRIKIFISKKIFILIYASKFKSFGKKVSIISPDIINGEEYISIEDRVIIQKDAWLLAYKQDEIDPILIIKENTQIGRYFHIVSLKKIIIEKNVLIADKVYISDNIHEYTDIQIPIKDQAIEFKNEVIIGENSWIGENVSIIGAKVGKHCVIGSNSVITKDIMDFSVVAGIPARYIKRYDEKSGTWKKTDINGEFIDVN